mmetsp:Transcript_808/g.1292  ORF Transcript_808/g.1292 Transcript_808/m.1292 type:complete len:219 (+) Transcript_808:1521-2177(+)
MDEAPAALHLTTGVEALGYSLLAIQLRNEHSGHACFGRGCPLAVVVVQLRGLSESAEVDIVIFVQLQHPWVFRLLSSGVHSPKALSCANVNLGNVDVGGSSAVKLDIVRISDLESGLAAEQTHQVDSITGHVRVDTSSIRNIGTPYWGAIVFAQLHEIARVSPFEQGVVAGGFSAVGTNDINMISTNNLRGQQAVRFKSHSDLATVLVDALELWLELG